jgi:nucleoid-associated protein YgaU
LGWGYHDNGGIDTIATGVGFYVSPMQVDIAYLIPTKTATDNSGQFRASFSYRFGRPQFSEIYYDRALEQASQLDQKVVIMTSKEAELKASLAELEQKKRLANDELENAKSRIDQLKDKDLLGERDATIRDLKERIRDLQGNLSGTRGTLEAIRKKQNSVRTHVVEPGETLQSIAREYYGDPNQWKRIYNANPDKIERGLPKAGSTLVIP